MDGLIRSFLVQPRVAYFSMEIALRTEIPTYSGGLGVLAGDTLCSAADLKIPLVGVTRASLLHSHRMMRRYAAEAYFG